MAMKRYPTVLTIAGSDSGGGAGIQADLKTIAALGAYGVSAITSLTAQNTMGIRAIHPVPLPFLLHQLEAIFEDFTIDAVKIGMIGTGEAAHLIAKVLDRFEPVFVVFDPVMVSTRGTKLIEDEMLDVLQHELFPRVDLVTPNLDEAGVLIGRPLQSLEDMKHAASEMIQNGCKAVLLKGGHLTGPKLYDVLLQNGQEAIIFETDYIESANVHGTGCTLSSSIATFLALGNSIPEAIIFAKEYTAHAIEAGKEVVTGKGTGPLNHSFSPQSMHIRP